MFILFVAVAIFIVTTFLFINLIVYSGLITGLILVGVFYILMYGAGLVAIATWFAGIYFFGQESISIVTSGSIIVFLMVFIWSYKTTKSNLLRSKNELTKKT